MSKAAKFFTFMAGVLFGAVVLGNNHKTIVNVITTGEDKVDVEDSKEPETEKES